MDNNRRPLMHLDAKALPQHSSVEVMDVCDIESVTVKLEEPEAAQMKEEEEEVCMKKEPLELKEEADAFDVTHDQQKHLKSLPHHSSVGVNDFCDKESVTVKQEESEAEQMKEEEEEVSIKEEPLDFKEEASAFDVTPFSGEEKPSEEDLKNKIWSAPALEAFLRILGDSVIQRKLDGSVRNEKVFKEISQRLAAKGFHRTSSQCRMKIKKMKMQYTKIKDESSRSGSRRNTWRWFNAMDAIYGHRPAFQVWEGNLDSAAAPPTVSDKSQESTGEDSSSFQNSGPTTSSSSTTCTAPATAPAPPPPRSVPENTANLPRRQYTAPAFAPAPSASRELVTANAATLQPGISRRQRQSDLNLVIEEMRAAEARLLERMEALSERHFRFLLQDAQEARLHEAEMARQEREQWAAFNDSFLGTLKQLVQMIGDGRIPMSSPRQ